MTRSRLMALLTAIVVIGGVVGGGWYWYSNSIQKRLGDARKALRDGDYDLAGERIDSLLESDGDSIVVRELAVRLADETDSADDWLKHSQWLVDNGGNEAANYAAGIASRTLGRAQFDEAEGWLKKTLELNPNANAAKSQLAELYSNQGRRWEALPLYTSLIRSDEFSVKTLILAGRTEDMLALSREYVTQRLADQDQVAPLLGVARFGIARDGTETAEKLLRKVIAGRSDIVEAPIRLAEFLFEKRPADFPKAMRSVPEEAEQHPAYWVLLGRWYRKQQKPQQAAGCFVKALQLDPNRYAANFQLSRTLLQLGKEKEAEPFAARAKLLDEVARRLLDFFQSRQTPQHYQDVSDHMQKLGRDLESAAWAQLASSTQPNAMWATKRLENIGSTLTEDGPLVREDCNPVANFRTADWPAPTFTEVQAIVSSTSSTVAQSVALTPIQMTNVATDLGADFKYFNGAKLNSETHQMYEFTGGGVGVIDYDLDGWPEFYLPNGTQWPPTKDDENSDALFRNSGKQFENVTELAGIAEFGFGQGVTVGDIDADGFPDIYVANTHRNQLWRNNGDGTFEDITDAAGITASVWTTSCVVADFNADGLADIYDVNFLTGDDVFTRICEEDGRPRSCPPAEFPGEQDRVLLNQGDGTFRDVTEDSGIVRPRGNGLGIIAADFTGTRKLNLFLANDSVPNFYYENQSSGDRIDFIESAISAGLDVDHAGKKQACMGVGLADVDANGRPDLFITNFYNESNALYLQQDENFFSDECRSTRVRDVSQQMLGFGTQFLDVDANGWPDIVVTNGHVDDFTHQDTPYQMRPQILRHSGTPSVSFTDQAPAEVDDYFGSKHLGRGLARLDFNRDGLNDYGVSHLDSPFALVKNETKQRGQHVSIRLVATTTERSAIGAIVRVAGGEQTFAHQLSAGDGYMASNERRLAIGLGSTEAEWTIAVEWMSGVTETFGSVPPGSHVVLIEGTGTALSEPE